MYRNEQHDIYDTVNKIMVENKHIYINKKLWNMYLKQ